MSVCANFFGLISSPSGGDRGIVGPRGARSRRSYRKTTYTINPQRDYVDGGTPTALVMTFPYVWRKPLGYDAALLSVLTAILAKTVLAKKLHVSPEGGSGRAARAYEASGPDLKCPLRLCRLV